MILTTSQMGSLGVTMHSPKLRWPAWDLWQLAQTGGVQKGQTAIHPHGSCGVLVVRGWRTQHSKAPTLVANAHPTCQVILATFPCVASMHGSSSETFLHAPLWLKSWLWKVLHVAKCPHGQLDNPLPLQTKMSNATWKYQPSAPCWICFHSNIVLPCNFFEI